MKIKKLTLGIIGRGTVVEKEDGSLVFQEQDLILVKKLADKFKAIIYAPAWIDSKHIRYELCRKIYRGKIDKTINNIEIFKFYVKESESKFKGVTKRIFQLTSIKKIFQFLKKPDIVLIFWPSPISLFTIILCKLLHKKYSLYKGGTWTGENPMSGKIKKRSLKTTVGGIMEWFILKISPVVFVRGGEEAKKNIFYIKGNSKLKQENLFKRKNTCMSDKIIILSVGSIIPRKGIDVILKAIKIMVDLGNNIYFNHVGEYSEENLNKMISILKKLNIEKRCTFIGYIGDVEKLISFYRKSDVFVLASYMEGFPRVIFEAMSQSLPAIATSVEGVRELFTDERELLMFDPGDHEKLAMQLERIIKNNELRKKLIKNGYEFAKEEFLLPEPADFISEKIKILYKK